MNKPYPLPCIWTWGLDSVKFALSFTWSLAFEVVPPIIAWLAIISPLKVVLGVVSPDEVGAIVIASNIVLVLFIWETCIFNCPPSPDNLCTSILALSSLLALNKIEDALVASFVFKTKPALPLVPML